MSEPLFASRQTASFRPSNKGRFPPFPAIRERRKCCEAVARFSPFSRTSTFRRHVDSPNITYCGRN